MTDSQKTFHFSPRPEAHAMKWDDLLPPVQSAVRDLLVRLEGAEKDRVGNEGGDKAKTRKEVGNCFLVFGARGTGKTTVLLSASYAVQSPWNFFGAPPNGNARQEKPGKGLKDQEKTLKEDAEKRAKGLENIVWLDVLDLEPLPPNANLLTTVLTRVRNALDSSADSGRAATTSIFEEGADSARQQFGRLINDATLMWEDIDEPDTRNKANRQVAAADIYASFGKRFKEAMDALSKQLERRQSRQGEGCSIVLPIDNIDRSTDHLKAIVKLAEMVSHPCLWLVMAGDRVEIDAFLERAYWKELIQSGDGAGARGKKGHEGEDEALVMARRQAAASSQKIWPINHRIEVGFVKPEDTLEFRPPDKADKGVETLRVLLEKVSITIEAAEEGSLGAKPQDTGSSEDKASKIQFINLFDLRTGFLPDHGSKNNGPVLTRAAQKALRLPARHVLDLWQLAYGVVNDATSSVKEEFKAEKIARTMLRYAIAGSKMPSAMGQRLQEKIIGRSEDRGTLINFEEIKIDLMYLYISTCLIQSDVGLLERAPTYQVTVDILVNDVKGFGFFCELPLPRTSCGEKSPEGVNCYPQPFAIAIKNEEQKTELPETVAAWLSVLLDVIQIADSNFSSAMLPGSNLMNYISPIFVNYGVLNKDMFFDRQRRRVQSGWQNPIGWKLPEWKYHLSNDVFWCHWSGVKNLIEKIPGGKCREVDENSQVRLLAAGFLSCVLATFYGLLTSAEKAKFFLDKKPDELLETFLIDMNSGRTAEQYKDIIEKFECEVFCSAVNLHSKIKEDHRHFSKDYMLFDHSLKLAMTDWLERELLCFLSPLCVPVGAKESKKRVEELMQIIRYGKYQEGQKNQEGRESRLFVFWKDNWQFILSDFSDRLESIFPSDNIVFTKQEITQLKPPEAKDNLPKLEAKLAQEYNEYFRSIAPFGDLLLFFMREAGEIRHPISPYGFF